MVKLVTEGIVTLSGQGWNLKTDKKLLSSNILEAIDEILYENGMDNSVSGEKLKITIEIDR